MKRTILETQLWPQAGMDDPAIVNAAMIRNRQIQGRFVERALFYEGVTFPTGDFGIVNALIHWLTLNTLREELERGSFRFLRYGGILGFAGNGNGISSFRIEQGGMPTWPWQAEALHGDFEKSLELQIKNSAYVPLGEQSALIKAMRDASAPFNISGADFISQIVEASYQDVMANPDAIAALQYRYPNQEINLLRFPEVAPDQMRALSTKPESPGDGPGIVLSAALLNCKLQ